MVRLPSSATQSDIAQAQKLISRGKEFAAFGDPKMLRIIQFIRQTDFQVAKMEAQKLALARQKQLISPPKKVFGPVRPAVVPKPSVISRKVFGPVRPAVVPKPSPISQKAIRSIEAPSGVGKFTKAMDVGRGKMQDVLFSYSRGKITGQKLIGKPIPKSKRFKEAQKILPLSIIPIPTIKQIKSGTIRAVDFVTGGALTERNLNKRGDNINDEIEKFNKKYEGKELTETEMIQANSISASIENKERMLLEDRDKLARSIKSKISGFLSPFQKRKTEAERKKLIKKSAPTIKKHEKIIKGIDKGLKKLKGKTGTLAKVNRGRLKASKKGLQAEVERLKVGASPRVFAGEFPIIPTVSIPSGITQVVFVGKQKVGKGGKIITDLAFRTSKGRVGIAKGVSVTKGKKTASVVLGRSGKVAFKFPSAKKKLTSVQSFIGREVSKTKPLSLAIKTKVKLLGKAKKAGTITISKGNIKALKQLGVGQVAGVKGTKMLHPIIRFPTGKIKTIKAKGILFDDFASISAIFTKKELSLIVGRTITRPGAKTNFIGLIKGGKKAGKVFSVADKQQFSQALSKVVSVVAAAQSKAKGLEGLTKAGRLAATSKIAMDIARARGKPIVGRLAKIKAKAKPKIIPRPVTPRPRVTPKPAKITGRAVTTKPKVKTKPVTKVKPKPVTKVKPTPRVRQRTRQEARQRSRQKQKMKQLQNKKSKLVQKQKQRLTQKQRLRLKQIQKQINKLALKIKITGVPTIPRVPMVPRIPKRKKKGKKKVISRKVKKKQAYNVYARPIKKRKKQKRPKLVKINRVPLKRKRAKGLRNYIVDHSLSRTARIKKTKGKPRKSKLRFPRNYAKKTSFKMRTYKIVKGKRKALPKGRIIEKRKRLLDTRSEKKGISLRRKLSQMKKVSKVKMIRKMQGRKIRKSTFPKGKITTKKVKGGYVIKVGGKRFEEHADKRGALSKVRRIRKMQGKPVKRTKRQPITASHRQQMLSNLAKGRAIRMANLRKKNKR